MSQNSNLLRWLQGPWLPSWWRVKSEPAQREEASARRPRPLYQSPGRLLALLVAAVFFGETCVMLLLAYFQPLPVGTEALLDASLLLIILSPTFYYLLFRPFIQHIQRQQLAKEEIRKLSQQLMLATEAERKKVAMDLHDQFGQVLTGLQFGLESLHDSLPDRQSRECRQAGELLTMARRLGDDIRGYASCLRPALIDDLGLVATLEWHVAELQRQHPDLRIDFRTYGLRRRPPTDVAEALFRICQEALNNVIKYAQARQVDVFLVFCHPVYILTVRDDGVGFDTARTNVSNGIGLWSMHERSALANGRLQINSRPGAGTTVRAELPAVEGFADAQDQHPGGG